MFGYKAKRH